MSAWRKISSKSCTKTFFVEYSCVEFLLNDSIFFIRLATYRESTMPIIDHFKGKDKVFEVNASESPEAVSSLISTFSIFFLN